MDKDGVRKSYRFIDFGMMSRKGNSVPTHSNTLGLDLNAIQWLASTQITHIYLKNNISNQMRKFTLTKTRSLTFQKLAKDFLSTITKEKK